MKKPHQPKIFNSLTELNIALGIPEPLHPLITLSNFHEATENSSDLANGVMLNFYQVSYRHFFDGAIKYGQHYYDFNNGGVSFVAPNQLMASSGDDNECEGITLLFHPDFLKGYPLSRTIKEHGFFSYGVNESLQLSGEEKGIILSIFDSIRGELQQRIDAFTQNVVISQIELLLNYCDRFYNRQFLTRKPLNNDLLSKMELLLDEYFSNEQSLQKGLPTVQYLAEELRLSPGYLSDMLRSLTGLNAQQHIHQQLVEKAKEHLATGQLSIAEIAYHLGFEHPQSFTKMFKKKTSLTPQEYKQSLHQNNG